MAATWRFALEPSVPNNLTSGSLCMAGKRISTSPRVSAERVVKTNAFSGFHQGVKGARQSGFLLGYSQIANPLYPIREGTMRRTEALALIVKNVAKNHLRVLHPEPRVDRWSLQGQLAGTGRRRTWARRSG